MVVACIPCLLLLTEKSLFLLVKLVQVGYLSFLTMGLPVNRETIVSTVLQTGKTGHRGSVCTHSAFLREFLRECMHYRRSPGRRGYVDIIFRVIQSYEEDKQTGKRP